MDTPLEAALFYASRGWPVIPLHTIQAGACTCSKRRCNSPGKHPASKLVPRGIKDATTNPDTIQGWWRTFPSANVAIATGAASGIVALDVDPRNGGDQTLAALERQYGPLPETVEAITGSGGRHLLFRHPGSHVKSGAARLGSGLDVKADGGYIAAAPSLHLSGRRYAWEASSHPEDVELAELPLWLRELLLAGKDGRPAGDAAKVIEEIIPHGQQHDTLVSLAGSMRRRGMNADEIFAALWQVNVNRCEKPGPEENIRRIAESVAEYEPKASAFVVPKVVDPAQIGVLVSEARRERVEWLWSGRIAIGKLTILDGDPGTGKSTLLCDLAARLTTNRPMPAFNEIEAAAASEPCGVVIVTTEDGIGDTIRPRLEAAEADLSRCLVVPTVPGEDGMPRVPAIPEDLPLLEQAVQRVKARLLIIDPLMAHLSGDANSYRDQDVRRALAPLADFAERCGVAVVVIRHLNKMGGGSPLYRGGGSIGIIGAARVGLLVGRDPHDEQRLILACTKNNLAPMPESLAFRVASCPGDPDTSVIEWEGASPLNASDLLAKPSGKVTKQDEAADWLVEQLQSGPVPSDDLLQEGEELGYSRRTLYRAKKDLGIRAEPVGSPAHGGYWQWHLPEELKGASRDDVAPLNDTERKNGSYGLETGDSLSVPAPANSGTLNGAGTLNDRDDGVTVQFEIDDAEAPF